MLQPPVPDLAAQSARTMPAAGGLWWASWYGGVHTPGYSVLVPPIVSIVGLAAAGAIATVIAVLLFARLTSSALRPRLASVTFAVLAATNLFAGRITFAIGGAFALGALVAAFPRGDRTPSTGRVVAAAALAVASSLASPVAGLFLGVAGAALVLAAPSRRRLGLLLAIAAAVPVLVIAVLFPDPGRMLFTRDALKPSFYASLGLIPTLYGRRLGLLRTGAALSLLLVIGAYLVTSPIGSNAERLALLFGAADCDRLVEIAAGGAAAGPRPPGLVAGAQCPAGAGALAGQARTGELLRTAHRSPLAGRERAARGGGSSYALVQRLCRPAGAARARLGTAGRRRAESTRSTAARR